MVSSSSASPPSTVMAERTSIETGGDHRLHQQPHLQCPRCNSSNTKFCYYNNYSLSQPRHFCKACKRYWTRGGTLRNVPVGGGCRKNKRRLKRPPPPPSGSQSAPSKSEMNNLSPPCSDRATNNPLIYGLPASNNPPEPLRFPSSSLCSGFDFLPEMSGFGLGFSSLLVNGPSFGSSPPPLSSSAGNMSVLFGSSASGSSSTMASLLSSTFQPQKFDTASHFKDLISEAANGASSSMTLLHHHHHHHKDVTIEEDPSSLLWSTNNLGSWFDPSNSNMGSSLSFLI